jgi:hypothetical protein
VDDPFFRVLFPGRFRVLGRALPPLSYWHLACLHALGSPFVQTRGDITLADVQLAVKCARARWPHPPDLRPTWADLYQRLRYDRAPAYVDAQAQVFAAWRAAHEVRPHFWDREGEVPRLLTAPALLARVAQLERLTKFSHDQAWNDVTPGYASWLTSTVLEQEGGELRFVQESDDEDDGLPDLNALNDAALYAIVLADRGAEFADEWLEARREAAQKEAA